MPRRKGHPLSKRKTTFTKFLTKARFEAKLSQAEIGKRIGKDKSYICRLERSTKIPPPHIIRASARAYEIDPDILLSKAGYKEFPWFEVIKNPDDISDSVFSTLTTEEKRELKRYLAYINIVNSTY